MKHDPPLRRFGALVVIAALSFSAGCSGDNEDPATGGPEPKTVDGAKAAAQTVFDRSAAATSPAPARCTPPGAKQAISREVYVKLNQACSRKGLAISLTSAGWKVTTRRW